MHLFRIFIAALVLCSPVLSFLAQEESDGNVMGEVKSTNNKFIERNEKSNLRGFLPVLESLKTDDGNIPKINSVRHLQSPCPEGSFLKQDGISCSTNPCDACPADTICVDEDPSASTSGKICFDCKCGFCDENNNSCCSSKTNGNQNVCQERNGSGEGELNKADCRGKANFFPGFSVNGNTSMCGSPNYLVPDFSYHGLPDSCGCIPSGNEICALDTNTNSPGGNRCFVLNTNDLYSKNTDESISCDTCLGACDSSYKDCNAQDVDQFKSCISAIGDACRDSCREFCVENSSNASTNEDPSGGLPTGGGGGDPHFKTFNGEHFSYHGHCDLVLMKSKNYAAGLSLDIQIRTTRIDKAMSKYSYISGIAMKINNEILEVAEDGTLIINGNPTEEEEFEISGYALTKSLKGSKKAIIIYDISLDHDGEDMSIQIRANTKTDMLFVDVNGFFPDSVGLLGNAATRSMMARDGRTNLRNQWNTYGENWQVQSDEQNLFNKIRAPQHPVGCRYEKENMYTPSLKSRRRLSDSGVDIAVAKRACDKLKGYKKAFCVEDIMVTGDLNLADDPFYH